MGARDVLFRTFIGIQVKITKSSSKNLIGLSGTIVDETKNLLVLDTPSGIKKIQKTACTFQFLLESGAVQVEGRKMLFRPEERPKKVK